MTTKKQQRNGVEWVGGLVALPGYVTGEGEPYRPEALFWMSADGFVLGSLVVKPGEALGRAAASLRRAIDSSLYGRPHAPTRVRVAAPDLAELLRAAFPAIEVVCAPTPEIDAMLAMMREKANEDANEDAEAEQSYLSSAIGPDAVASLFRAAARVFRAEPWRVVPSDHALFSVTIEKLGLREGAMSVIGQMGQSPGWIVFSGIDDFGAYLEAADAIERGDEPPIPPHVAVSFERGAELSPALREEIAAHGWEVAGPDAYPRLLAIDEDLLARPLTAKDVATAEAVALALPEVLSDEQALLAAWNGGAPVACTVAVATHAGELEVVLRAPYGRPPARPSDEALSELFDLAQGAEEIAPDARRELEAELVRRFAASPEAEALPDVQFCDLVMDFAANRFGATIATLGATELRELVFEIIPRTVSIDASAARGIIEEVRAFYAFLEREFAHAKANACLRVLGGDAVEKLEAAMSDPRNFGIAKSVVMAGREAGFDIDSKEGVEALMRAMEGQPLPASVRLPSYHRAPQATRAATAKAKQKPQRKAARKARKKNR